MNNHFKLFYRCGVIYLISIAAFLLLMIFSAALPHTRKFDSLMRRSARILAKGGDYPEMTGVTLDHYTDSMILNVAYSLDPKQPVRSSMRVNCSIERDQEQTRAFLDMTTGNNDKLVNSHYERYWFGQSAVMKLMHYFWHIDKIYVLYGSLVLFLSFFAILLAYKNNGAIGVLALFFLLALCNFQVFFQSLQYLPVICIALTGMIVMLYDRKDSSWRGPLFFTSGMLTAFFDLLTAPILAFGIPALFICGKDFLQAESTDGRSWKNWFRIWCGCPAAWLAGYIMSWGTKILLGICFAGGAQQIFQQIFLRIGTSNSSIKFTRWQSLVKNFQFLYDNTQLILLAAGIVLVLFLMVKIYQWKKHKLFFNSRLFLGYLMLAVMPVAVIIFMANHTYIHGWMTYRGLALTCAALFMSLTAFQPEKKVVP